MRRTVEFLLNSLIIHRNKFIVVFNIFNLPTMLAHGDMLKPFEQYPFILSSFILFQILIT